MIISLGPIMWVLILRILLMMATLLPGGDEDYRTELASAIAGATTDEREIRILVRIARWESFFRRDVGECLVLGKAGEVGPFQNLSRSPAERVEVCASLAGAARVAVGRIRESEKACASLPGLERGAAYARGKCDSTEGRRLSRLRWEP